MPTKLHIVGIQADLTWENPIKNLAFFEEKIHALHKEADLIVLPEMFSSGFTMRPKNIAEKMTGNTVLWMQRMARKERIALVGSLVIEENKNYYNRLLFVHPCGKTEWYDKKHAFTLAGEDKVYTAGSEKLIVTFKGWKICPLICYDLRFPVWSRNAENYDLLIYVANWPAVRIQAWKALLKARAIENMSFTIGVNRIGIDANKYEYSGDSSMLNCMGEELSTLKKNENGIIKATLVKTEQDSIRERLGFLNDQEAFKIL
jgi:omega-amidase